MIRGLRYGPANGRTQGRKNVENGHMARMNAALTHEDVVEAARKGGRRAALTTDYKKLGAAGGPIGGSVQGRKNVESGHIQKLGHMRWHVAHGVRKPGCVLCFPILEILDS